MKKILRALAIGAIASIGVGTSDFSAAFAAQLFGLVDDGGFGSIDPATGNFTAVGGGTGTKRRFFAVLHMGAITSPVEAVRAAIVAEHKATGREK